MGQPQKREVSPVPVTEADLDTLPEGLYEIAGTRDDNELVYEADMNRFRIGTARTLALIDSEPSLPDPTGYAFANITSRRREDGKRVVFGMRQIVPGTEVAEAEGSPDEPQARVLPGSLPAERVCALYRTLAGLKPLGELDEKEREKELAAWRARCREALVVNEEDASLDVDSVREDWCRSVAMATFMHPDSFGRDPHSSVDVQWVNWGEDAQQPRVFKSSGGRDFVIADDFAWAVQSDGFRRAILQFRNDIVWVGEKERMEARMAFTKLLWCVNIMRGHVLALPSARGSAPLIEKVDAVTKRLMATLHDVDVRKALGAGDEEDDLFGSIDAAADIKRLGGGCDMQTSGTEEAIRLGLNTGK